MSEVDRLREANASFAKGFDRGDLEIPPARPLAVLTCIDARLDPARFLGLDIGDAYVIRNAGGRATEDAIRSLLISSWLLGTRQFQTVDEVVLSTKHGIAIRFDQAQARSMGRNTRGVKGITLEDDDEVVAMATVDPTANLLAVSTLGSGKRTEMDEYRITHRGGKGIITMRVNNKTGPVIGVLMVTDEDQLMLITSGGKLIRLRVSEVLSITPANVRDGLFIVPRLKHSDTPQHAIVESLKEELLSLVAGKAPGVRLFPCFRCRR